MDRRDFESAEAAWRRALREDPDNVEYLYGLGWTQHLSRQDSQARVTFDLCVRKAPENSLGHKGLGSVAMSEGNAAEAEKHLQEALVLAPGDPAVLNGLALLRLRTERAAEALQIYERLRDAHPEKVEPALGHAEALLRLGRIPEARSLIEGLLDRRDLAPRERAFALQTRARILLDATTGKTRKDACEETAPPVLAWLAEAEADLGAAETLDAEVPDLPSVRRLISRRRSLVAELCPAEAYMHTSRGKR
jgi:predicted Zn-dependent protease